MDNKEVLKMMKQRRALMAFLNILHTIGVVMILFSKLNLLTKIVGIVMIVLVFFIIMISINQHDKRTLKMDMNPLKYYAHIHYNGRITNDASNTSTDDADIAYLLGNYDKALEIYQNVLNKAKANPIKLLTMTQMLMAFFEINDYETAKRIINDASNIDVKGVDPSIYFGFYNAFFSDDYDTAIKLYNDNLSTDLKNNTAKARMMLYIGIAYYKKGDMENAKKQFEFVASYCPMLNYSKIAISYLNTMQKI